MTRYEAFGRVERGRVAAMPAWAWPAPGATVDESRADGSDATVGGVGAAPERDWFAALREQWSMTTFFCSIRTAGADLGRRAAQVRG